MKYNHSLLQHSVWNIWGSALCGNWARSGSFASANCNANIDMYVKSSELNGLIWIIISLFSLIKGRPIWYTSVSGDNMKKLTGSHEPISECQFPQHCMCK